MSTLKVNTIRHTGASSDAVTLASDGTCTAKITNNLSNRNLIINGAMNIAQRGTSTTTNNDFPVDRFRGGFSGIDGTITFSQHALTSSDTGPWAKGFRNSCHVINGNQTGGAGTSDKIEFYTRLEAQDIANSGWDYTSTSSYITLSFWVKSSVAQNFYGYIINLDGTIKNYPFETGALSANTWTKITKTLPGHADLSFNNDNGEGLRIVILPFLGTDQTGSVSTGSWSTYNSATRTPDNTSTWYTTDDATFEFTGVQLEVGDVATDFEHRSYGDELARCQRYYYRWTAGAADNLVWLGQSWGTSAAFGVIKNLPVTMRATPTSTVSGTYVPFGDDAGTSGHTAFSSKTMNKNNPDQLGTNGWTGATGIGSGGGKAVVVTVEEAAGYIDASAEL